MTFDYTKYFCSPKQLPFCAYKINGDYIQLNIESPPITNPVPFDDLFIDVASFPKEFAANHLANEIARLSRRGPGNILFVPDEESAIYYNTSPGLFTIIINPDLKPNELRCAYWKIHDGKTIDGGIQFSPDGFSCLTNNELSHYKNYFVRCFWS